MKDSHSFDPGSNPGTSTQLFIDRVNEGTDVRFQGYR